MTSVHATVFRRSRRATKGRPASTAALVVAIIVILVAAPSAQQQSAPQAQPGPAFVAAVSSSGPTSALAAPTDVDLLVGRSTVLNIGSPIARVSLTVPDIADAMVTAPGQLLIHGKQPGTISLFVWDRAGAITTYEVTVRRDLTALGGQLKQLFPGEQITAVGSGKDVVLSGTVSGQYVIDKAASVAAGYVEKKENVVNLLRQQEGVASNQVMLRVRFAEVSRSAVMELGASLFTGPTGYKDVIARTTTQQFTAPNYTELSRTAVDGDLTASEGKYSLSDFLNIFVFSNKLNIGTVVRALQEKGLFQSLAEPNLIATNGKEASFLAGGEYPYPVVQGGGNSNAVTIMFKEFGVRLSFTPTVMGGDLINLKVKPEVSSLDFANAVTVSGFRVPSLMTRRTETEVELRDGQTFAIAGLLNNTVQDSMRKIPGIGDIPILGWLFKSRAMQKAQTELVVMITPTIVRRGQTGVSEGLPSPVESYLDAPARRLPNPDPYVGSPRYPANQPAPRTGGTDAPAPVAQPIAPTQGASSVPQVARPVTSQTAAPAPRDVQAQPAAPPLASRPVPAPAAAAVSASEAKPKAAAATKQELKALQEAREEERKAAAAAAKQRAEQERLYAIEKKAAAKAEEARRIEQARVDAEQAKRDEVARLQAEKLAKEREKREAEEAKAREKREADAGRKKAEEDQKRDKALSDAASRLKEAQAQYQLEIDRATGGNHDTTKKTGSVSPSSASRQ